MYHVFWYGKKDRDCTGVWTHEVDAASDIAHAMVRSGWMVVWLVHSSTSVEPYNRQKWVDAYNQWKIDSE